MLLDNLIAARARATPDRIALLAGGRAVSYAELDALSASAAGRLVERGAQAGDRVVLVLPAGIDLAVALHALGRIGAVAVPLDARLPPAQRETLIAGLGAKLTIEDSALLTGGDQAAFEPAPLDLDAPHCVIQTSGTTGQPKPVELTWGNQIWSAAGSALNLGVDPADRWLCCLPVHHVSGLSILMRSALYGTAAVVHDGFDADRVAAALDEDGVTLVSLVATALARLLEVGAAVDRPRAILLGGGPAPVELLEEAAGREVTIVGTYGMTEAASQVTAVPPERAAEKLGSAGRQLVTTRLRIDDGEIVVGGPTVAPGCLDAEGWYRTGDCGRLDAEGFLWVEGRLDEMIVSGGENVMPAEVEAVLRSHPAVAEVAVFGRPDPEWQQAVTAVVVPRAGAAPAEEELRAHCAAGLAPHKVPKRIDFADRLPRR